MSARLTDTQELLRTFNEVRGKLDLAPATKLGQAVPGTEAFMGRRVFMVDNELLLLKLFVPLLMLATRVPVGFIFHDGQSAPALADEIMSSSPDAVLMDFDLNNFLKGTTITADLRARGYKGDIIGASGRPSEDVETAFLEAGAQGVCSKVNPVLNLPQMAALLRPTF